MGLFNKNYKVNLRTADHSLIACFKNDVGVKIVSLVESADVTFGTPSKTSSAKRIVVINEDLKIPIGDDVTIFLFKDSYLAIHID